MPNYYPIMLDIRGRQALVLGGDCIAAAKACALHASGAHVTVMDTQFCPELLDLHEQGSISLLHKSYLPGDLAGAFVVVATTNDQQRIKAIWQETQERGQLLNIVDLPTYCNFIIPSILRRDQLTIAVSTEGASPSLAKRIRQQLEELFSPAYGIYLRLAAVARKHMRQQGLSYAQRDNFFGDFFTLDILAQLAEQQETQAVQQTAELLQRYEVDVPTSQLLSDLHSR